MKYNEILFQPEAEAAGKGKPLGPRTKQQKLKGSGRHRSCGHRGTQKGRGYVQRCSASVAWRPERERMGGRLGH